MFIKKLTNTCVAVLMLGMGIFTGCSGDNSTTAGVYTETNSGKPAEYLCALSQLDTSLVKRSHNGSVSVCHTTKDIATIASSLDSVVVDSSFDSDDEIESYVICGMSIAQTMLFINVRVRFVDSNGKPVAGAAVYKDECWDDERDCQYTTDKDGFLYLDSVHYASYFKTYSGSVEISNTEEKGLPEYETVRFRVRSADTSLGVMARFNFANVDAVKIDGELFADLKEVVLGPLYSVKIDLDTVRNLVHPLTKMDEVKICAFWVDDDAEYYDPLDFYSCQLLTKEEVENESVVINGLVEGSYNFEVYQLGWRLVNPEPVVVPLSAE